MGLENYVPVSARLAKAQGEHKGLVIKSDVQINWDKEGALVKVTIEVDGKEVSTAHALAPDLGEDKALEKAETSAIGRALANMGYPAEDGEEEAAPKKSSAKKGGLGGVKKASKPKDEEEDESEEESESEEEEEEEKPAPKKGLPKMTSKKKDEEEEEETEEESDDSEEEESEEEESEEEAEEEEEKPAPKKSGKLSGVMAKYGMK